MSKTSIKTEDLYRPDPSRSHPPIDKSVKLPRQVRSAAARAEDLIAGKQPRPDAVTVGRAKARPDPKIPYSDAQIDAALKRLDQGRLDVTDPEFNVIIDLAREGARLIKAHRQGARAPRRTSTRVTRRLETLFQAFIELSPKLQAHPTGVLTVGRLLRAVVQKQGLSDTDETVTKETIRQDIRQLRPLLRLVQQGKIPKPDQRAQGRQLLEKTLREMEAGRQAVAKAAAGNAFPKLRAKCDF